MEGAQILTILLSITLIVFLSVATMLVVIIIKVARNLRAISEDAKVASRNVLNISQMVKRNIQPTMIGTGLFKVARSLYQRQRKKGGMRQ